MIKNILKYILEYSSYKTFIFLTVLIFISNLFTTIGYFLLPILAMMFASNNNDSQNFLNNSYFKNLDFEISLVELGYVTIVFIFLANLFTIVYLWLSSKFANETGAKIQINYFRYYIKKEYLFFLDTKKSSLANDIILDIHRLVQGVFVPFFSLINAFTIITIIIISLSLINFKVILLCLSLFSLLYWIIFFKIKDRLYKSSEKMSLSQKNLINLLDYVFSPTRDVKLYRKENYAEKILSNCVFVIAKIKTFVNFSSISPRNFIEGFTLSFIVAFIIVIYKFDYYSDNLIIQLSFFLVGIVRLLPALQQGYVNISQIQSNISLLNNFSKIKPNQKINNKKNDLTFNHSLRLKNIDFSFDKNKKIFNQLNFEILKGDKIAIVGDNGAGKTTLLNIIMGMLIKNKGEIYIDNNVVSEKKLSSLFHCLEVNPIFFGNSIEENITFGQFNKRNEINKISEIIKKVKLKNKYRHLINNKKYNFNTQLSQGEKQKLNFARYLYFDRPIIIIDEGTSNLSKKNETSFFKIIDDQNKKNSKTLIYVSHRITNKSYFNKIYKIENNKLTKIN